MKYYKWVFFMLVLIILILGISATSRAAENPTPYITITPGYMATPVYSTTPIRTATSRRTPTPRRAPTPRLDPIYYENDTWEVVTGSANNTTATGATIDVKIILHPAKGLQIGRFDINMALQYWDANDPANKIAAGTLKSSSGTTTLTLALTGLNPDTIYMFQAVKQSGLSPYPDGAVKSFRTLPLGTPSPSPTVTSTPIITPTPRRTATPRMVTLTVSVSPRGCGGSVKVNPPGTQVSTTMKFTYPYGTVVTLTARAFGGSLLFLGWGGVYPSIPTVTITMSGNKSVTAYYGRTLVSPTIPRTPTPIPTPTPISNPTPDPVTPPPGPLKVQFYNQSIAAITNQIYLQLKLVNTGSSAIALSNVKIRYYYTVDGAQPQTLYCDYASVGAINVSGAFVTMTTAKTGADTYLEIGFGSSAGSVAPGGNATIQGRFAKSDWSNYTQTNDYSFNSVGTSYMDWTKVTGYISGTLVWGTEP